MKDFLGQDVNVGDTAVTFLKHYRHMIKATVKSIAPKTVELEYLDSYDRPSTYRVSGDMFVVVDKLLNYFLTNLSVEFGKISMEDFTKRWNEIPLQKVNNAFVIKDVIIPDDTETSQSNSSIDSQ